MSPHLDAIALLPEITLACVIALVIVADLIIPRCVGRLRPPAHLEPSAAGFRSVFPGRMRLLAHSLSDRNEHWLSALAATGVGISLITTFGLAISDHRSSMIDGRYVVDDFSLLAKGLVLASTVLVILMGVSKEWKGEYLSLLCSSVLGMVMIGSARDLLLFFVVFELLAIPGYLLVGWHKKTERGNEAVLKYYLLGVLATAIMLYGLSLLFGVQGSTAFSDLALALTDRGDDVLLVQVAIFFVMVGIAFKVSAVPFHFWAPDVYQGAPLPVAAFLSVASKAAGLIGLAALGAAALPEAANIWAPIIWIFAAASMVLGNLVALRQTDMVRLLAYSSIAQAGYALVPLAVVGPAGGEISDGVNAMFEFLIIYAAMTLGAFAIVIAMAQRTGTTAISSFDGLLHKSPILAATFIAFLLSLAGIPPFGGWFAKLVIFGSVANAASPASIALGVFVAVGSAIGLVYYAVIVRRMWSLPGGESQEDDVETLSEEQIASEVQNVAVPLIAVIATCVVATIAFGVFPAIVTELGGMSSLVR